jgi:lactate 2-monooxygenase
VDSIGRRVQGAIYGAGAYGDRPKTPVLAEALEAAARAGMSREAWSYVTGWAGQQRPAAANRAAFDRWRIVPRLLRDISTRDMSVELFGRRLPAPVLLPTIGASDLVRRHADLAVARGAAEIGVPMIISSQARTRWRTPPAFSATPTCARVTQAGMGRLALEVTVVAGLNCC